MNESVSVEECHMNRPQKEPPCILCGHSFWTEDHVLKVGRKTVCLRCAESIAEAMINEFPRRIEVALEDWRDNPEEEEAG